MKQETEKTRYSDVELQEFKELILDKLRIAKEELNALASSLSSPNANGTDDTAGTYKTLEDGESVEYEAEDGPKGLKALRVRRTVTASA